MKSKFYWPVTADSETETEDADQQGSEILIEAEGEYKLVVIDNGDRGGWAFTLNNQRDLHLRYTQEQPGLATPFEGEIVAHKTRLVTDTMGTGLKTYSSLAAWRDDVDREKAGMAMFISLALTGGRITNDDFTVWLTFQPGEVVESNEIGPDGRRVIVFEAERVNRKTRDSEDWKVWLDSEGRPSRIELTITSDDPERSVRGAELEITYSGEVLKPAGAIDPE